MTQHKIKLKIVKKMIKKHLKEIKTIEIKK
jgi:hypothetical protein